MNLSPLLLAVVLGAGMLSCQMTTTSENRTAGPDSETLTTGLEGRVMMASPCPGPVREDQPCPDQPFSAAFDVLNAENKVVARFQSDAEGRFQIKLKPGTYTVRPDTGAPLFNAPSQVQAVTVQAEGITEVTLRFDSGMR